MSAQTHPSAAQTLLTEHRDYVDAQETVDRLSDAGFPVEHLAIVGRDLVVYEDVTGRRRYGRAALSGAASGAAIGAFFGLVFSLFAIFPALLDWLAMVLLWTALGAVAGAVAGLIGHAMQGGRRDFSSTGGIRATRYEVLVSDERHTEALRHLDRAGSA